MDVDVDTGISVFADDQAKLNNEEISEEIVSCR